jgi:hypothetical protein
MPSTSGQPSRSCLTTAPTALIKSGSLAAMPQNIDAVTSTDVWRALSTDQGKIARYSQDDYFIEGLQAAERGLGHDFAERLSGWAVMVIHPDLIAQRRVERALNFLRDHAFEPLFAVPFVFGPTMTAAMWKESLGRATEDSLTVCDVFCGKTDSLLLVVADRSEASYEPASVRLTELKGPTVAAKRHSGHLRSYLEATNRIVTAVHCSDEPIDILRELAILLPGQMVEFLTRADAVDRDEALPNVEALIAEIYARTPPHDLNVANAADRLLAAAPPENGKREAEAAKLRLSAGLRRWRAGDGFLVWRDFVADLRAMGVAADSWDAVLLGTQFVQHSRDATRN